MPFVPDKPTGRFVPDQGTSSPSAAPSWAQQQRALTQARQGAAETLLHYGSSALATPVAGVAGLLDIPANWLRREMGVPTVPAADVVSHVEHALTYEPHTTQGKGATRELAVPLRLVGKAGNWAGNQALAATGSPAVAALTDMGVQAAPMLLGKLAGKLDGEDVPAADVASTPRDATPLSVARTAGYHVRPSDVRATNPSVQVPGLRLERLQIPGDLTREMTLHNAATTTRLAAQDVGAPSETAISPTQLDQLRQAPMKVYGETGQAVGTFTPSQAYASDLDAIADEPGIEASTRRKITAQVNAYRADQLDGPDAVKTISVLRRRATRQLASPDVATQDLGLANRRIADALEHEIGRRLAAQGDDAQLAAFRDARTRLAKIDDVESATKGGQVDAHVLAKLQRKGVPLTGRLKVIADTAEYFPNVTKHPSAATGTPGLPIDTTNARLFRHGLAILGKVPGLNVGRESFQTRLGPAGTDLERGYLGHYGTRIPRTVRPPTNAELTARLNGRVSAIPRALAAPQPSGPSVIPMTNDTLAAAQAARNAGLTPDVARAAGAHPGVARPAGLTTRLMNTPIALPAPGQIALPLPNEAAQGAALARRLGISPDIVRVAPQHPGFPRAAVAPPVRALPAPGQVAIPLSNDVLQAARRAQGLGLTPDVARAGVVHPAAPGSAEAVAARIMSRPGDSVQMLQQLVNKGLLSPQMAASVARIVRAATAK